MDNTYSAEPSSPIRNCWPPSLLVYVWHIFHPRLRFTNCMRAVCRLLCRSVRRRCRMQSSMVIATGPRVDRGKREEGALTKYGVGMGGWRRQPRRRSPAFCRVSSGRRAVSCRANERMVVVQLVLFPSGSSGGCLNQSPLKNSRPRLTRTSVPIPRPPLMNALDETRSACRRRVLSLNLAVCHDDRQTARRRRHGPRHPRQNLV
jgi:hypothetical protein